MSNVRILVVVNQFLLRKASIKN